MGCQVDKASYSIKIQVRAKSNSQVGEKFQQIIESNNPKLKLLQQQWSQIEIIDLNSALEFKQKYPCEFSRMLKTGALSTNRWNLWMASLYVEGLVVKDKYNVLKNADNPYEQQIENDLKRTLPGHSFFLQEQSQLRNVLRAISLFNEGYVTGMNQVTGFFLLINGMDEEQTFLMVNYLNANEKFKFLSLYHQNFEFATELMNLFHKHFEILMPKLYQHFSNQGIDQYCYVWPWMFTLFLQTFPFEAVLYFFDFMIATNIKAVISLSLALLKHFEDCLLQKQQIEIGEFIQKMVMSENVFYKSKKNDHLCVDQILQIADQYHSFLCFE